MLNIHSGLFLRATLMTAVHTHGLGVLSLAGRIDIYIYTHGPYPPPVFPRRPTPRRLGASIDRGSPSLLIQHRPTPLLLRLAPLLPPPLPRAVARRVQPRGPGELPRVLEREGRLAEGALCKVGRLVGGILTIGDECVCDVVGGVLAG